MDGWNWDGYLGEVQSNLGYLKFNSENAKDGQQKNRAKTFKICVDYVLN